MKWLNFDVDLDVDLGSLFLTIGRWTFYTIYAELSQVDTAAALEEFALYMARVSLSELMLGGKISDPRAIYL